MRGYIVDNSRFIVRMNKGVLGCFYYEKGNILYKETNGKNISDSVIVAKGVRENFTVNLCQNEEIYLFCQNLYGDIVHIKMNNGKWAENIILKCKDKNAGNIILYCIENGQERSIIYNVPSKDKNIFDIMMQTSDNKGNWGKPYFIDKIIPMQEFIFKVDMIDFEHSIIFYRKYCEKGECTIGYRTFNNNNIGEYNPIYSTNYRVNVTSFLACDDCFHSLFSVKNIFSSRIVYRKKCANGLCECINLAEVQYVDSCQIFIANNKLYAVWKIGNNIFYCVSENNGESFSKVMKFPDKNTIHLNKTNYLSFVKMNSNDFTVREVYTDRTNICNIEILPNLYKNFNKSNFSVVNSEKVKNVYAANYNNSNNNSKENTENDKFIINNMQAQINMLNNKLDFKDTQIEQLNNALKRKNEEFANLRKSFENQKQKYKKSLSESKVEVKKDISQNTKTNKNEITKIAKTNETNEITEITKNNNLKESEVENSTH